MSLSRLHLRTRLDIFNVFFTISSIHSNPSPSPSSSQSSPPSYSSRYPRQCLLTISTIRPSIPLLSLILTSVSPTFPSAISTFYLVAFVNVPSYSASIYFKYFSVPSRCLLCFYSPFSMSSLMSLRLLRRRMRDRPRHFVSFKFVFSPSRRFGLLLSAIVQHVR
jgi:hypothetical protein